VRSRRVSIPELQSLERKGEKAVAGWGTNPAEEANPGQMGSSWADVFWNFLCGLFYDTQGKVTYLGTKARFALNVTARFLLATQSKGEEKMPLNTSLPDQFQEQFEQTVRDVISGVSHTDGIVTREIPDPSLDDEIDIPEVPELSGVSINSAEDELNVGVDLYCEPIPEGEIKPVPDDIAMTPEHVREERESREPTYLKELGSEYAELSESLLTVLSAYCDVPEDERDQRFGGYEPDFLCKMFAGEEFATFGTYVWYPEYVEEVYTEGQRGVARRLGLPY
jgi:hypothetical protein